MSSNFPLIIDTIGWIGSILVVLAYGLNMYKKLSSDSSGYYLLNIIGSIGLATNTYYHHAIPSCLVNIIWIAIALPAAIRGTYKTNTRQS